MAAKTWTITDLDTGAYLESLAVSPADVGGEGRWSVAKRTLRGGVSDGVDVVEIDNGALAFTVVPTRGMSIHRARTAGGEIGWRSPVRGPVHPRWVPIAEPSGLGWLDGFDELLVRCGLESNGAPEFDDLGRLRYPLHGRVGNLPARRVELSVDGATGEIRLAGVVEEARFHFAKLRLSTVVSTRVGESAIHVHDEIENVGGGEAGIELLYHVNFGLPLLDAGSRLVAPVRAVVPRNEHAADGVDAWDSYLAPEPGYEEQVYFLDLAADANDHTRAMLKNAHGSRAACLHFRRRQLPCFTLWKNTAAEADGYVTGLEPGLNFPNPRSFEAEHGRVRALPVGGKHTVDLKLEVLDSAAEVEAAEASIAEIAGSEPPTLHRQPLPEWCAP